MLTICGGNWAFHIKSRVSKVPRNSAINSPTWWDELPNSRAAGAARSGAEPHHHPQAAIRVASRAVQKQAESSMPDHVESPKENEIEEGKFTSGNPMREPEGTQTPQRLGQQAETDGCPIKYVLLAAVAVLIVGGAVAAAVIHFSQDEPSDSVSESAIDRIFGVGTVGEEAAACASDWLEQ